jgi:hypothetical protein
MGDRKELLMKKALYRHLFTTKTLVRVAFTTLSLNSMGTAVGQGLPAGTAAPVYGTAWAATQAQPSSLNALVLALAACTWSKSHAG